MTSNDLWLITSLAMFVGVFILWRLSKKWNRREGWDAHKNGLPYNVKWGTDVCVGWEMRAQGLPRP